MRACVRACERAHVVSVTSNWYTGEPVAEFVSGNVLPWTV